MKAKGTTPPNIPKSWLHNVAIQETDTDEERLAKYRHNALVINQKPYFFIYLYKNLAKDYKDYQKGFDILAKKQFGCSLANLLTKERTESETNFLRRYRKYSPVIETACVMNQICKSIEKMDNSIKWDKSKKNVLMDFADFTNIDKKKIVKIYELVKLYNSRKSVRSLQILVENDGLNDDDINDMFQSKIYTHKDTVRETIRNLFTDEKEMFNHMLYMCMSYNMQLDIVWEIMNNYIVECIPFGNSYIVTRNDDGVEYLGQKLKLKEVQN